MSEVTLLTQTASNGAPYVTSFATGRVMRRDRPDRMRRADEAGDI